MTDQETTTKKPQTVFKAVSPRPELKAGMTIEGTRIIAVYNGRAPVFS